MILDAVKVTISINSHGVFTILEKEGRFYVTPSHTDDLEKN